MFLHDVHGLHETKAGSRRVLLSGTAAYTHAETDRCRSSVLETMERCFPAESRCADTHSRPSLTAVAEPIHQYLWRLILFSAVACSRYCFFAIQAAVYNLSVEVPPGRVGRHSGEL